MLLIGGKNLVPLVSAAVIQSLGWRWVFIIVAIIVAVMFILTYLFVPETAWDRSAIPSDRLKRRESHSSLTRKRGHTKESTPSSAEEKRESSVDGSSTTPMPGMSPTKVRFAPSMEKERPAMATVLTHDPESIRRSKSELVVPSLGTPLVGGIVTPTPGSPIPASRTSAALDLAHVNTTPLSRSGSHTSLHRVRSSHSLRRLEKQEFAFQVPPQDIEPIPSSASQHSEHDEPAPDTEVGYRFRKKTYRELLTVYQGRFSNEKWWKAALRPFILYAYPAIAFATLLYSLSVVWLIVMSEVIAQIFQAPYFPSHTLSPSNETYLTADRTT